ncbi:hypothetical protein J6590_088675 [Homalodisca vitripennis]|nr:hypothetical protein J6590_088675 [Homalodisca vitripennis]
MLYSGRSSALRLLPVRRIADTPLTNQGDSVPWSEPLPGILCGIIGRRPCSSTVRGSLFVLDPFGISGEDSVQCGLFVVLPRPPAVTPVRYAPITSRLSTPVVAASPCGSLHTASFPRGNEIEIVSFRDSGTLHVGTYRLGDSRHSSVFLKSTSSEIPGTQRKDCHMVNTLSIGTFTDESKDGVQTHFTLSHLHRGRIYTGNLTLKMLVKEQGLFEGKWKHLDRRSGKCSNWNRHMHHSPNIVTTRDVLDLVVVASRLELNPPASREERITRYVTDRSADCRSN